jgi:hypothetical protein
MLQITLTDEQAKLIVESHLPIEVRDQRGNVLGHIEPALTPERIAELKRRARAPGPRYTGAQVQARLQALEQEWQRRGGLDEATLRELLRQMNEQDPGHMRSGTEPA